MFEDARVSSQFQCLDSSEPTVINLLCGGAQEPRTVYQLEEALSAAKEQADQLKDSLRGVLLSYEMSFHKKVQYSGDGGDEVNISSKNNSGLARLSTIKEDSPEFGPISDSSDVLKQAKS